MTVQVIEVVARLGETILDVRYVSDGVYVLAGQAFQIPARSGVMRVGLIDVAMTPVEAPRRSLPAPPLGDRRAFGYIAGSLALHLVLWASLADDTEPGPPIREIATAVRIDVARLSAAEPVTAERGDSPDYATNGAGSPMVGAVGAAGGDAPRDAGHIQIAQRAAQPSISKEEAIERARQAGFLGSGALRSQGFRNIGVADLSSGFDHQDIYAPLLGGSGDAADAFGIGRMGNGPGGGCTGDCNGIIGVGRYGTLSNGQTTGDGWGGHNAGAAGIGQLRARVASVPTVMICAGENPCYVGKGGLDKAIIRRYLRRHLAQLTYCYEKELIATPDLDGQVMTNFLIAADGRVQSITATGVTEAVSSCVAGVIGAIEFPPSHDGSTEVHYPFGFRRAGT